MSKPKTSTKRHSRRGANKAAAIPLPPGLKGGVPLRDFPISDDAKAQITRHVAAQMLGEFIISAFKGAVDRAKATETGEPEAAPEPPPEPITLPADKATLIRVAERAYREAWETMAEHMPTTDGVVWQDDWACSDISAELEALP